MSGTVTVLLRAWRTGDRAALDEMIPIVYGELHRIAAARANDRHMRPTELVAEAYAKLAASDVPDFADRTHFFAVAARCMRQILIDNARSRVAEKRGGGKHVVTFDDALVGSDRSDELLALDRGLAALAEHDERKARIVELYYFGGMTQPEIAVALELHVNTIARELRFSEAWIRTYLEG